MTTTSAIQASLRYHVEACEFLFDALRFTQEKLERNLPMDVDTDGDAEFDNEESHISGPELLDGIREYALLQFGLMAKHVFRYWGVTTTEDFGRIVFDLVEQGKMRKTDRDQLSDFYDVYDFDEALDRQYRCTTEFESVQ